MTEVVDTPPAARTVSPKPRNPNTSVAFLGQRFGLAVLFILIIIGFSALLPSSFPTALNFRNITSNESVLAIVTLASIIPLLCGHFDLSVGANLGAATIISASLLEHGAPLWVAIIVPVIFGALLGLLNGVMVAKIGVNALIITLGIGTVILGLITKYTGGQSILNGIPDSFIQFGADSLFGFPYMLYVLVIVALLAWWLLEHTPFGRELHAVGANPLAARLVGIRVDRVVILSFVLTGALASFAGVLELSRLGSGNPQIGGSFTIPVLSSAFLGATTIHPGRFNVPGTLLAVFFLGTAVSGLALAGVDSWVGDVFNGGSLIVAVTLSTVLGRRLTGV